MALDITIITNAFAFVRSNPTMSVTDQETHLANAFKQFLESADVIYSGNLTSPSGPVTPGMPTTTIAQLQ